MTKTLLRTAMVALGASAVLCGSANAAALLGKIYENDTSNNADTSFSGVTPSATFIPTDINYQSGNLYTIAEFLGADAASLSKPIGGDTANNLHITITGFLGLKSGANNLTIGHDDGVRLILGGGYGTVVDAPTPTSFFPTDFTVTNTGAPAEVSFTLDYNECCGAPADLEFKVNDLSPGLPEPASWTMMLAGFGLAGAALRRRNAAASAI